MKRISVLLAVVLAAACSDRSEIVSPTAESLTPAYAASDNILFKQNFTVPFNFAFPNRCTRERVQLSGDMHVVSFGRRDETGTFRWTFHGNPMGISGVGVTSGTSYRLAGAENTKWTVEDRLNRSFHQTASLRMISQGSKDDFHLTVRVAFEFVDGQFVGRVMEWGVECRG